MSKFAFTVIIEAEGWSREDFEQEAGRIGTMTIEEIAGVNDANELDEIEEPGEAEICGAMQNLLSDKEAWVEAFAGSGSFVHIRSAYISETSNEQ